LIKDYSFSELSDVRETSNLFTLHENSQFPLFWDVENATVKHGYLEMMSDYHKKLSP
jgi:hypothetical protein